jgi:hypothetical protein
MRALAGPKLIYLKGLLFLIAGALATTILVIEHPQARTILLLSIAIWCFARFYYFAFYVIERYVDSEYRFSGMWSLARYLLRRARKSRRA